MSNLADLANNKKHSQKYNHVLLKLVIMTPQITLWVDLIRQYTLKSKDNTSMSFMCLTMIDPATSWLNIIKLPIIIKFTVPNKGKGKKATYILT
jgi:hypothetical protein